MKSLGSLYEPGKYLNTAHLTAGLKKSRAGQPRSFCRQFLQAICPRTQALPEKFNMINPASDARIYHWKSVNNKIIPAIAGKANTSMSGIRSFTENVRHMNLSGFPFLKNKRQINDLLILDFYRSFITLHTHFCFFSSLPAHTFRRKKNGVSIMWSIVLFSIWCFLSKRRLLDGRFHRQHLQHHHR